MWPIRLKMKTHHGSPHLSIYNQYYRALCMNEDQEEETG